MVDTLPGVRLVALLSMRGRTLMLAMENNPDLAFTAADLEDY